MQVQKTDENISVMTKPPAFNMKLYILAGGIAGVAVDAALFPLDTLKTRLQSPEGFIRSGGFHGVYSGLKPTVIGSVPTAALFFFTYENVKSFLSDTDCGIWHSTICMCSAAIGEIVACTIRVPVEILKQRRQAGFHKSSRTILQSILKSEGFTGLYRGYLTTIFREIPFSFIQFPLWEGAKTFWTERQRRPVSPWQSSICGAISGGIAAALTTPLDVAKTRIMLADPSNREAIGKLTAVLRNVYIAQGLKGLFAGIVPRVLWISFGGAIFLGVYDKSLQILSY